MTQQVFYLVSIISSIILLLLLLKSYGITVISILKFIQTQKTLGPLLFIILFAISTCISVPATISTISSGILFKPVFLSIALVLAGSQLGMLLGIFLGKTILLPIVNERFSSNATFKALQKALASKKSSFKIIALLRVSPVVPFGLANYMLSVMNVKPMILVSATLVGNIPGATLYSLIGAGIGKLEDVGEWQGSLRLKLLSLTVGIGILGGTIVYIGFASFIINADR